jgi:dTMP kinase
MLEPCLGKFIVFEGVEGCGKTTQLQRVQQWLPTWGWGDRRGANRPLLVTREPGGTDLGVNLRQLLLGHTTLEPIQDRAELLLYAADRAQHVEGVLRPALAAGRLILCDRYTDSTVAYQGYGRGLDLDLIYQLNAIATHGLESDLTFWLDLDAEVGLARAQQRSPADRIEQSGLAFHRRVQQGFTALATAHPHRIVTIDASLSPDAVAEQIQTVLTAKLEQWFPEGV